MVFAVINDFVNGKTLPAWFKINNKYTIRCQEHGNIDLLKVEDKYTISLINVDVAVFTH